MVNVKHLKVISEYLILDNGSGLRISEDAKAKLKIAFEKYIEKSNDYSIYRLNQQKNSQFGNNNVEIKKSYANL